MSYEQVYLGLRNRGMSDREAAAFAANAGVESNFNPAAHNPAGGGQGAHGLFQWRGSRYNNLQNFAATASADPTAMDPQLDFVAHEYRNDPGNAWGGVDLPSLIRDAPNDYEAAKLVRKHFERPGTDEAGYGRLASYLPEMPEGYEKFDAVAQEADRQSLEGFASGMQQSSYHYHNIAAWMQREGAKTEEGMLRFEQERTGMGPRPRNETPPGYHLPGTAGAPPSSSARTGAGAGPASKSSSSDEASTPESWPTRLAKALFPNHENPNTGMGDVLSALSTGLGQMSTGQAVDLSPVFTRMAQRRRDALYQENALADRALQERRVAAEEDRLRAASAAGRLDPAVASQLREALPAMGPLIDAGLAGDKEAVKTVYKAAADLQKLDPVDAAAVTNAASLFRDDQVPDSRKIAAYAQLPEASREVLDDYLDLTDTDSSNAVRDLKGLTEHYMSPEGGGLPRPEARARAEEYLKSGQIGNMLANQQAAQQSAIDVKEYNEHIQSLNDAVSNSGAMRGLIDDSVMATIALEEAGAETGPATPLMVEAANWLASLQGDGAVDWMAEELGIDREWASLLNSDGMQFMYALAQELNMVGRGFTPEEARMIQKISPSAMQTYEGRTRLLSRLMGGNDAKYVEQQIMTNPEVTVDNYREVVADNAQTFSMVQPMMAKVHDYWIKSQTEGRDEKFMADAIAESGGNAELAATAYVNTLDAQYEAGTITAQAHAAAINKFEADLTKWKDIHMPSMRPEQWELLSPLLPQLVGYRSSTDRGLSSHMQLR